MPSDLGSSKLQYKASWWYGKALANPHHHSARLIAALMATTSVGLTIYWIITYAYTQSAIGKPLGNSKWVCGGADLDIFAHGDQARVEGRVWCFKMKFGWAWRRDRDPINGERNLLWTPLHLTILGSPSESEWVEKVQSSSSGPRCINAWSGGLTRSYRWIVGLQICNKVTRFIENFIKLRVQRGGRRVTICSVSNNT